MPPNEHAPVRVRKWDGQPVAADLNRPWQFSVWMSTMSGAPQPGLALGLDFSLVALLSLQLTRRLSGVAAALFSPQLPLVGSPSDATRIAQRRFSAGWANFSLVIAT